MATATVAVRATIAARERIAAPVKTAARARRGASAERRASDGYGTTWCRWWWWWRCTPPLFPPAEDLPVLRCQCAEDRLQGREASLTLHLRARQDRPEPHHRGIGEEAARAGAGDQARPLSGTAALHRRLT